MEQKTISINPNLFTLSKPKKEKKEKKNLPLKITSENNVKKELINKIKSHQKTKKNKSKNFTDEFDNSMSYLKNIIDEIKEKDTSEPIIHSELPNSFNNVLSSTKNKEFRKEDDNEQKPWGNLKNGNKPTYRTWMKQTRKNVSTLNDDSSAETHIDDKPKKDINSIPLNKLPEPIKVDLPSTVVTRKNCKVSKKRFIKKTIKRKYNCGKSKTKKQLNIIIKDLDTKNKIIQETNNLAKIPIKDVKKYLYDRSFIKIGTTAPETILRKMYESCILSGNIKNENSENLIHNYFNS